MPTLQERALSQTVITSSDFDRVTANMSADMKDLFASKVVVIDAVNGIPVRPLFAKEESFIERAILQGGINHQDYGRLSPDERRELLQRNVGVSTLPSVNVYKSRVDPMLRSEFEKLSPQRKDEIVKSGTPIVDTLPPEALGREQLNEIATVIAARTRRDAAAGSIAPNTNQSEGDEGGE